MEPRLGDRGKKASARSGGHTIDSSMEPRLGDRGKEDNSDGGVTRFTLQWSRGWVTAERRTLAAVIEEFKGLQWSRGWVTAERGGSFAASLGDQLSSMEPRLGDRGKTPRQSFTASAVASLQWSRGWVTAERNSGRRAGRPGASLQWSRGWVTAESRRIGTRRRGLPSLQWSRGWVTAERSIAVIGSSSPAVFNGAAVG